MPFIKGREKTGGRQKGSFNKVTQDLNAILEAHGFNPFEEMVMMAMTATDANFRFNVTKELSSYVYPKRKALEVSGDMNLDLAKKAQEYEALSKEQQIELMEKELKRLKGG
mgnify:CR=1 FL=1